MQTSQRGTAASEELPLSHLSFCYSVSLLTISISESGIKLPTVERIVHGNHAKSAAPQIQNRPGREVTRGGCYSGVRMSSNFSTPVSGCLFVWCALCGVTSVMLWGFLAKPAMVKESEGNSG